VHLERITIIVDDYDEAIGFFTGALGFDLVEDAPSLTNDGRPKRWVVVRPPGAQTGILLARADGERQAVAVGGQMAGRVGFFLQVDDNGDKHVVGGDPRAHLIGDQRLDGRCEHAVRPHDLERGHRQRRRDQRAGTG
jgi:catechol 2,3-dioxygenase-like lactoylglutathione lyase family enzyme